MPYSPIEDYGMIGNMRTVALVSKNGSIDWFCYPRFDSPSLFARILDDQKGGSFSIQPVYQEGEEITEKQFYWPDTNVLVTRFLANSGVGEITDYMPLGQSEVADHMHNIVRRVRVVRGRMRLRMRCLPAFDYARGQHRVKLEDGRALFHSDALSMQLLSSQTLQREGDAVVCVFDLQENETASFIFTSADMPPHHWTEAQMEASFRGTIQYWRKWLSQCTYRGRWQDIVYRSALTLKMLTYEPTGAIVAAPTCALPEDLGGVRNWDYRYTWIRDAAFTVYAFLRIGFTEEAAAFMTFIEARCQDTNEDGTLQIMYGIDGRKELEEFQLDHLDGYKGSRPVRIGNGAYDQLQLDIYGELMDSVYLFNKYGTPIGYDFWQSLRKIIDWNADNYQLQDEGIWEVRGGRRHFTYSKLMSWVAIDRGIRLAEKRSLPADREKWYKIRDQIHQEIMEEGWNSDLEAFVQSYGGDTLDASLLMMPLVFFVSPTDDRMLKTLKAINRPPDQGGLVSNSLVYRYNVEAAPDGLKGEEGTFNICTFWMVEALTRAGKADPEYLEAARLMFEQMLGYANHLGLYAEETGACGEALGNFPQAFTHLALISAAFNLNRTLEGS